MNKAIQSLLVLPLCLGLTFLAAPAQAIWKPQESVGDAGKLKGHERDIYSVDVSVDGRFVATGSFDGTTRVWDTQSWEYVHEFPGHSNWVSSVAFTPDGQHLATGGMDGRLQIWALSNGANVQTIDTGSKILSLSYSPDGSTLAVGGYDQQIRIYQSADWSLSRTLEGHGGSVVDLQFSPDGTQLASVAFNDVGIRLWDMQSGALKFTLNDHYQEVYALAYSPDGKYLASGGADKVIRLWNLQTLVPVARLSGHLKPVWSLHFHPGGRLLASGSIGDHTLRLWSIPQGANIQTLVGAGEKTYALHFHPQGQELYSAHADASLRLWQETRKLATTATDAGTQALNLALRPENWQDRQDGQLQAGEKGLLKVKLVNTGTLHLEDVRADVIILSKGVELDSPVQSFFLARFDAGSEKILPLPLILPTALSEAVEMQIRLSARVPGGETQLPLRIPLNQNLKPKESSNGP